MKVGIFMIFFREFEVVDWFLSALETSYPWVLCPYRKKVLRLLSRPFTVPQTIKYRYSD